MPSLNRKIYFVFFLIAHYIILTKPYAIGFSVPYILGSSRTISINYQIENLAEPAFKTQLSISILNSQTLFKIPSVCRQSDRENELLCDINGQRPVYNTSPANFTLTLDATKLTGKQLVIEANVCSEGNETDRNNNKFNNTILFGEYSEIEISGWVVSKFLLLTVNYRKIIPIIR